MIEREALSEVQSHLVSLRVGVSVGYEMCVLGHLSRLSVWLLISAQVVVSGVTVAGVHPWVGWHVPDLHLGWGL